MKKEAKKTIQKLFDLKQSAVYIGRSVCSVRELVWAGKLPYVRFDRKISIDISDLDKFIEQNKVRHTF